MTTPIAYFETAIAYFESWVIYFSTSINGFSTSATADGMAKKRRDSFRNLGGVSIGVDVYSSLISSSVRPVIDMISFTSYPLLFILLAVCMRAL